MSCWVRGPWLAQYIMENKPCNLADRPRRAFLHEFHLMPSKKAKYSAYALINDGCFHIKALFTQESLKECVGMFSKTSFLNLKHLAISITKYTLWPLVDGNLSHCEFHLIVDAFEWAGGFNIPTMKQTTNILKHDQVARRLRSLWRRKRITQLASLDLSKPQKLKLSCFRRLICEKEEDLLDQLGDQCNVLTTMEAELPTAVAGEVVDSAINHAPERMRARSNANTENGCKSQAKGNERVSCSPERDLDEQLPLPNANAVFSDKNADSEEGSNDTLRIVECPKETVANNEQKMVGSPDLRGSQDSEYFSAEESPQKDTACKRHSLLKKCSCRPTNEIVGTTNASKRRKIQTYGMISPISHSSSRQSKVISKEQLPKNSSPIASSGGKQDPRMQGRKRWRHVPTEVLHRSTLNFWLKEKAKRELANF